jgi:hypothetical protein
MDPDGCCEEGAIEMVVLMAIFDSFFCVNIF